MRLLDRQVIGTQQAAGRELERGDQRLGELTGLVGHDAPRQACALTDLDQGVIAREQHAVRRDIAGIEFQQASALAGVLGVIELMAQGQGHQSAATMRDFGANHVVVQRRQGVMLTQLIGGARQVWRGVHQGAIEIEDQGGGAR